MDQRQFRLEISEIQLCCKVGKQDKCPLCSSFFENVRSSVSVNRCMLIGFFTQVLDAGHTVSHQHHMAPSRISAVSGAVCVCLCVCAQTGTRCVTLPADRSRVSGDEAAC